MSIQIERNLPCFIAARIGLDSRLGEAANLVQHFGVDGAAELLGISHDECEARWKEFVDVLGDVLVAGRYVVSSATVDRISA